MTRGKVSSRALIPGWKWARWQTCGSTAAEIRQPETLRHADLLAMAPPVEPVTRALGGAPRRLRSFSKPASGLLANGGEPRFRGEGWACWQLARFSARPHDGGTAESPI